MYPLANAFGVLQVKYYMFELCKSFTNESTFQVTLDAATILWLLVVLGDMLRVCVKAGNLCDDLQLSLQILATWHFQISFFHFHLVTVYFFDIVTLFKYKFLMPRSSHWSDQERRSAAVSGYCCICFNFFGCLNVQRFLAYIMTILERYNFIRIKQNVTQSNSCHCIISRLLYSALRVLDLQNAMIVFACCQAIMTLQ